MLKKYSDFINEGLNDFLIGPTKEEISKDNPYLAAIIAINDNDLELFKLAINNMNIDDKFNYYEIIGMVTRLGKLDFLKIIIKSGVNIHTEHDIMIYNAVIYNYLDMVKYLINKGVSVNTVNGRYSILSEAVKHYNIDIVKYLVERGADIHLNDNQAIKIAKLNKHIDIVIYLEGQIAKEKLTEGLNNYLKGPSEEEVWNEFKNLEPNIMLVKSARIGFLKGVEKALKDGANIHYDRNNALRWSILNDHLNIMIYLIEHGADIHTDCDYALRHFSKYGDLDMIKNLVKRGAYIHANYDEPLKWSAHFGHLDVVKYLEEQIEKEKKRKND